MIKLYWAFVLVCIFAVSFGATTLIFDAYCSLNGYYQTGIQEEQNLFK